MRIKSRLRKKYEEEIVTKLMKEFGIKSRLAVPRVEKVVVNSGIGEATKNKDLVAAFSKDMEAITGQKPSVRKARISVASFGVREGMPVGLKVTLRGNRMYDFLDKLFSITFPRLRDFRGVSDKKFDTFGNYTLGFEEQTMFPEIDLSKMVKPFGLEITIVTSTKDQKIAKKLLTLMGMPFEKKEKEK